MNPAPGKQDENGRSKIRNDQAGDVQHGPTQVEGGGNRVNNKRSAVKAQQAERPFFVIVKSGERGNKEHCREYERPGVDGENGPQAKPRSSGRQVFGLKT